MQTSRASAVVAQLNVSKYAESCITNDEIVSKKMNLVLNAMNFVSKMILNAGQGDLLPQRSHVRLP